MLVFNAIELKKILFSLAEIYNIKIKVQECIQNLDEDEVLAGIFLGFTLIGAFLGGRNGSLLGGAAGSALGAYFGLKTAEFVKLKDAWQQVKDKLEKVFVIIYEALRSNGVEYYNMAKKFISKPSSERDGMVEKIMKILIAELGSAFVSYTRALAN